MTLFPKVMELLRQKGIKDILVTGGGIIPAEDVAGLKKAGISEVFGPGTNSDQIIDFIRKNARKR
jgi:methylmalonyl-CoA mutase C-terminal domain/subunit